MRERAFPERGPLPAVGGWRGPPASRAGFRPDMDWGPGDVNYCKIIHLKPYCFETSILPWVGCKKNSLLSVEWFQLSFFLLL